MKKIVKITCQVIISLLIAKVCIYCGEITNCGFSYGIIWCLINNVIFDIKIECEVKDENGNKTTKRIY